MGAASKALSRDVDAAPVDPSRIGDVASRINDICRTATLDLAFRVGEIVIRELYDGSFDTWTQEGTRRPSYRKLAQRGDLLMSPSALCRAVAVYSLCERLGGRASWRHLTASHLQEVLSLPAAQQERLLNVAEAERWPVARLRAEVSKRRPTRRRTSRLRPARLVERLKEFLGMVDLEVLDGLEASASEELSEVVGDVQRCLAEIESALQRAHGSAMDSEKRLKCPPRNSP